MLELMDIGTQFEIHQQVVRAAVESAWNEVSEDFNRNLSPHLRILSWNRASGALDLRNVRRRNVRWAFRSGSQAEGNQVLGRIVSANLLEHQTLQVDLLHDRTISMAFTNADGELSTLERREAGWFAADGRIAVLRLPDPLALACKGCCAIQWTGGRINTVKLKIGSLLLGGLPIPEWFEVQANLVLGPHQEVITTHSGSSAPLAIEVPRLRQLTGRRVRPELSLQLRGHVEGADYELTNVPVVLAPEGLALGQDYQISRDRPLRTLNLQGPPMMPDTLELLIARRDFGSTFLWRPAQIRKISTEYTLDEGDDEAANYRLVKPLTVDAFDPPIGQLCLAVGRTGHPPVAEIDGWIEIVPPPFQCCWRHPVTEGPGATVPALALEGRWLTPDGRIHEVTPLGQVRYAGVDEEDRLGELDDTQFDPILIPPPRSIADDLPDDSLQAWLPKQALVRLRSQNQRRGIQLSNLDKQRRTSDELAVRLGGPAVKKEDPAFKPRRGVYRGDPAVVANLDEVPVQGRYLVLPRPSRGEALRMHIWFRGMLLPATLTRLDADEPSSITRSRPPQFAILLDDPLPVDAPRALDIGPFLPVRAWLDSQQQRCRLQDGGTRETFAYDPRVPFPWVSDARTLRYFWPGHGFMRQAPRAQPGAESPLPHGAVSWRDLILWGDNRSMTFGGWTTQGVSTSWAASGPFSTWGVQFGARGLNEGPFVTEDQLRDPAIGPAGFREACQALFQTDPPTRVQWIDPDDGGEWLAYPFADPDDPDAPVTRIEVISPIGGLDGARGVRIWMAR
ncbi:MAG: hypothetical protein AAGA48_08590 [Myxococcota bacterium]